MKKKILIGLLSIITVLVIYNISLVSYLTEQAYYQLKIIFNVEKTEVILNSPEWPDSVKSKIRLIRVIKQFASDSIGLKKSKSYETFYDQKGKPILWVVKACPPFELKPYEWSFPLAGNFAYQGYFKEEKAIKEQQRLKALGYDTRIGQVNGWSTLGILNDPILSNMIENSTGELAEVIIHELTHGTIFLKNNLQFNENLASFVGETGAREFLVSKYGNDSKEYIEYINQLSDFEKFHQHIYKGIERLDSLYKSFKNNELADSDKLLKKTTLISEIIQQVDTLTLCDKSRFKHLKDNKFHANNAWFTSFMTYRSDLGEFEKEYQDKFNCDLKKYIEYLKTK